ncbi:MAG TPA: SDR family NAD(P)-dependent oxidoreductase [Acidimicrobiales bacterium]|nr:SDR family NAD(P)-dependent oxidoreductase [Acidimicrobiales bacterium]
MIDLTDRVALVTGAGRNVGAGIARTLAACGAAVAVNDLVGERAETTAAELRSSGARAIAVAADVTEDAAVQDMVSRTRAELGPVDVLVNNAGVPSEGAPFVRFRDMPMQDWDRYLRLNLHAVLLCTRAVLDEMCDRNWGRIITISSEAGRAGTPPGLSLYAAAKAGAVGFSRVLAREVGRHGVTVNCVSLGTIDNGPIREEVLRATPMRRYGNAADVGAAVAYLASDGASWVTGQTLPVNGGFFTT